MIRVKITTSKNSLNLAFTDSTDTADTADTTETGFNYFDFFFNNSTEPIFEFKTESSNENGKKLFFEFKVDSFYNKPALCHSIYNILLSKQSNYIANKTVSYKINLTSEEVLQREFFNSNQKSFLKENLQINELYFLFKVFKRLKMDNLTLVIVVDYVRMIWHMYNLISSKNTSMKKYLRENCNTQISFSSEDFQKLAAVQNFADLEVLKKYYTPQEILHYTTTISEYPKNLRESKVDIQSKKILQNFPSQIIYFYLMAKKTNKIDLFKDLVEFLTNTLYEDKDSDNNIWYFKKLVICKEHLFYFKSLKNVLEFKEIADSFVEFDWDPQQLPIFNYKDLLMYEKPVEKGLYMYSTFTGSNTFNQNFVEDFNKQTTGIFKEIDWTGLIIAGGFVFGIANAAQNSLVEGADIDIFIYGPDLETKRKTIRKLLESLASHQIYYVQVKDILTLIIPYLNYDIQIICTPFETAAQVINDFDQDYVQCFYQGSTNLYFSLRAMVALQHQTTGYKEQLHAKRILKTLNKGIGIYKKSNGIRLKKIDIVETAKLYKAEFLKSRLVREFLKDKKVTIDTMSVVKLMYGSNKVCILANDIDFTKINTFAKTTYKNSCADVDESKQQSSTKPDFYAYNDIDFSKLTTTRIHTNYKQPTAFIKYGSSGNNLLVKTGKIKLGLISPIVSIDSFCTSDSKREFILVGLDECQSECLSLKNHLKNIDKWASSIDFKTKLFGVQSNNYEYKPCIKKTNYSEDEDDFYKYVKMKFIMMQQKNKRINLTKIYKNVNGGIRELNLREKKTKNLENEIHKNTSVVITFSHDKIWINETAHNKNSKIEYGVGLRIKSITYDANY